MITMDELLKNKPVLFDGAMGTSIQSLGLDELDPPELLNIKYPEKLEEIHKNYIDAGSKVIETNTFGGSGARLGLSGLEGKVKELNIAAVKTAKNAARNSSVFVAGSVGPSGLLIEPFGDTPREKVKNYFREQIDALLEGGVDMILIETMISLDEALIALEAANEAGSKLTGVTLTFNSGQQGMRTSFGESPSDAAERLEENGAKFIGSNCGHGFNDMLSVAKELRFASNLPLLIQPNAGLPTYEDGKIQYNESPELYGKFVLELFNIGVELIGGCCGTTYEHIKLGAEAFKSKSKI